MIYPLMADGGTGTNLIKAGMKPDERVADFILKNENVMKDLQLAYIEAGSKLLLTPTFGVNRVHYGNDVSEYNERLVSLTLNLAKQSNVFVAGEMSPTGLFSEPMGTASFEEIYESFAEQIRVFEKLGTDFIALSTMYSLSETRIALLAIRELTKIPALCSLTVDKNGKTMSGNDICTCIGLLQRMGASAAGMNCSTGPDDMITTVKRAASIAEIPLMAKPNAGTDPTNYLTPDSFASYMKQIALAGASIIGGCCGTTPEYIKKTKDKAFIPDKDYYDNIYNKKNEYIATDKSIHTGTIFPTECISAEDALDEAYEAESLRIEIDSMNDVSTVLPMAWMFDVPICVECGDFTLLKELCRKYCGQITIGENSDIDEQQLKYLSAMYAAMKE